MIALDLKCGPTMRTRPPVWQPNSSRLEHKLRAASAAAQIVQSVQSQTTFIAGKSQDLKKKNLKAYSCCRFCLICPMISAIRSSCQRPWVQGKRWRKHGELPTITLAAHSLSHFHLCHLHFAATVSDTVIHQITESALSHDAGVSRNASRYLEPFSRKISDGSIWFAPMTWIVWSR